MLFKGILVIFVQVLLYEMVFSQCLPNPLLPVDARYPGNRGFLDSYNPGLVPAMPIMGRVVGGNLIIDTSNPNGPGVTIFSENLLIEGAVMVNGNLPFLGTVALEGVVPASGRSAVSYECGTGTVGIINEAIPEVELAGPGIVAQNGIALMGAGPSLNRYL